MLTTKSRAQGNSVVVTLPINGKEKPKVDETYLVFRMMVAIILIPKNRRIHLKMILANWSVLS